MPLFGSKKGPQEICKNLSESLAVLKNDASGKKSEKVCLFVCVVRSCKVGFLFSVKCPHVSLKQRM